MKTKKIPKQRRRSTRKYGVLPLRADEEVLFVVRPSIFATWPKYLLTMGLYALWRSRNTSVLTNHRVLMGRGVFDRWERSIPLNHIVDAVFTRRGFVSYAELLLDGPGRMARIGPLMPTQARELTSEILTRVD